MKFIVYAPPYNPASAGIKALHELHNELIQLGHESKIVFHGVVKPCDPKTIVIYPEIISDNPLSAQYVVRYMLNSNGFITGVPIDFGPKDFILTWENFYHKNAHAQLHKPIIPDWFHDRDTISPLERSIDSCYIGKSVRYNVHPVPNTILINSTGPLSRKALASLLRQTRILYTFDPLTMMVPEALFCGAFICVLNYQPWKPEDFGFYPTVQIENNNLIIPLDYTDQRDRYINMLKSAVKNYRTNLANVVKKIQKHYDISD